MKSCAKDVPRHMDVLTRPRVCSAVTQVPARTGQLLAFSVAVCCRASSAEKNRLYFNALWCFERACSAQGKCHTLILRPPWRGIGRIGSLLYYHQ